MTRKLTLSIDEEVIARAKTYAEEQGRSLSEIFEQLLTALCTDVDTSQLGTRTRSLLGAVKTKDSRDIKAILRDELSKRFA